MDVRKLEPHERIIVALDVSDIKKAIKLAGQLHLHVGVFKVGFEAIYSAMADMLLGSSLEAISLIYEIKDLAKTITAKKAFLDVKLADIPNTVGKASQAIARLSPKMFNVHASAGKKAIAAAVANKGSSLLFGVTVLTSIGADDPDECVSIFGAEPGVKVIQFAKMLVDGRADGVICAPKEGILLRSDTYFDKLTIACPNIRPEWVATKEERERVKDDQNIERQMTPGEAIKAGIDMLVIGRPITNPPAEIGGPVEAAKKIAEEIKKALNEERA